MDIRFYSSIHSHGHAKISRTISIRGYALTPAKAVSRHMAEASEAEALLMRRFDGLKLLIIYVDGLVFSDYTMIGAVGVDTEGRKHVLGILEGATENSTVVTELLEDIMARDSTEPSQPLY